MVENSLNNLFSLVYVYYIKSSVFENFIVQILKTNLLITTIFVD